MGAKLERCVKQVRKQGKKQGKNVNPYAICKASIKKNKRKTSMNKALEAATRQFR